MLIYMFVYIYIKPNSDRKSIALWMRRKRSRFEVGTSLGVSRELGTSAKALASSPRLPLTSAELGPPRGLCSLWVPSIKSIEGGGHQIRMRGTFHSILL